MREVKPLREAAGKLGFERRDAFGGGLLVPGGLPGEMGEIGLVAGCGDNQRAGGHDLRVGLAPQFEANEAQLADDGLRALGFAIGSEHGAGEAAGAAGLPLGHGLAQGDVVSAPGQLEGLPQPEYAAANDENA